MGYMFMPDKTAETIDEDGKRPLPGKGLDVCNS